jgi:uncharacterized protein YecT (DUF1311 family)
MEVNMRTLALLALVLSSLLLASPTPVLAQSQQEMNREAEDGFRRADVELNRVYQELLPRLPGPVREKLIDAQLAWIRFRDAEAEARAWEFEGGTMYPFLYYSSLEDTTRQRSEDLRIWLESLSAGSESF